MNSTTERVELEEPWAGFREQSRTEEFQARLDNLPPGFAVVAELALAGRSTDEIRAQFREPTPWFWQRYQEVIRFLRDGPTWSKLPDIDTLRERARFALDRMEQARSLNLPIAGTGLVSTLLATVAKLIVVAEGQANPGIQERSYLYASHAKETLAEVRDRILRLPGCGRDDEESEGGNRLSFGTIVSNDYYNLIDLIAQWDPVAESTSREQEGEGFVERERQRRGGERPISVEEVIAVRETVTRLQEPAVKHFQEMLVALWRRKAATVGENKAIVEQVKLIAEQTGTQLFFKGQPASIRFNAGVFSAVSADRDRRYLGSDATFLQLEARAKSPGGHADVVEDQRLKSKNSGQNTPG